MTEYYFEDLKGNGNRHLKFDFAIFDNEKNLKLLIEYNGSQHYQKNLLFHSSGVYSLEKQQEHDRKKFLYCQKNNINLLIIGHKNINTIKSILDFCLKNLK